MENFTTSTANHQVGKVNSKTTKMPEATKPPNLSFEEHMQGLVDDKYNREYKLDRKTRAKAIEILKDYYAKNQEEANVSCYRMGSRAYRII